MTTPVIPLDVQKVRNNGTITLRVDCLKALGAKNGDYVTLRKGPVKGTLIVKREDFAEIGPATGEEEP